ncbi:DUF5683 domain-containing protein [Flammeovirga sp. EKP202]|uniref:DUF5683 domain-containing protein n=1 Tax=Flammeovirga sp. EKP202 TaxID=2770592 RepID=UPI00165FFCB9|nr:DUF5683 domain-containing protein [Flammeovirga sp. EKP202]MBD0403580.1 hypothetical protein [Flammeovirga sp. EKP202]
MLNKCVHIAFIFITSFFIFFSASKGITQTIPQKEESTEGDDGLTAEERNQKSLDSLSSISAIPNHIDQKARKKEKKTQYKYITEPTKASFYTIAVPGLGQIYNRKLWKLPLLYGGMTVFIYFVQFNHNNMVETGHWLAYKADADPTNDHLIPEIYQNLSVDNLRQRRDNFRRDRDFMIILSCMWYLLGALDAAVDQHLKYYDISEDLSMKVKPAAIADPYTGLPAVGMTVSLKLSSK